MGSKQLTYHQFKQIARTLGDSVSNPEEIAHVSGLTDMDYDLLHEYLLKWNKERSSDSVTISDESSDTQAAVTNVVQPEDQFETLGKKSLLALFRSTLESSNDGILIIDNNGKLIDWNEKFFEIAKIPKEALENASEQIGLEYIFNQVKDPQALMIELGRLEEENSMKGDFGEVEFIDGRTIERYTQPLILDNKPVGRVWCFKDITEEKEHKNRINILTSAIQSATQGIVVLDGEEIIYINDYLRNVLKVQDFNIKNNKISNLNNPNLTMMYQKICDQLLADHEKNQLAITVDNKNMWFELSTFVSHYNDKNYALGIMNDVTQNKVLQDQLSYNAYHDLLTGLPNRTSLLAQMKRKIMAREQFGVYFLDLDNFKLINDSLGHHIGDILLKKFGQKLQKVFSDNCTVGRIGGDEFVIIANNITQHDDCNKHAKILQDIISHPIKVQDYEFNITLTMGVAIYPHDAATPVDLIKNADSAMYQKKASGKNGIAFYDSKIKTKNMRKMTIANKIYKAIENNELTLHYQPIIDLSTQKISSVETLLRWNNKELGGFVPPDEFIAVTEEIGYIDVITNWVFENSLQQLRRWHAAGYDKLRITINLSGALLYNPSMANNIYRILASSGVDASAITVELTENIFINDSGDITKMIQKMKDLGLKVAIDDFGTGYSSYAYLQNLPIDVIKIDKMFTQQLSETGAQQNKAIILSIIELGKHAGYDIVAEGIETINQMKYLDSHNCKYGQGYYFSRPIPAEDMERMLYENSLQR
ncbi:MAG: EAL domain-containing protein [Gammaproteobacteria bacterium]|nr:EAL domain-containing protein [Gammaproteobacteria bacterium]